MARSRAVKIAGIIPHYPIPKNQLAMSPLPIDGVGLAPVELAPRAQFVTVPSVPDQADGPARVPQVLAVERASPRLTSTSSVGSRAGIVYVSAVTGAVQARRTIV